MKKIHLRLISLLVLISLVYAGLFAQNKSLPFADFYVSTAGNDNWSGKLAEPNSTKTDGPFATVNRAKHAVRLIKKDCYRNIYVLIRGGEYRLSETEVFTSADSHYDAFQIVYMAYPGENPVFSSDVKILGWQPAKSVKNLSDEAKGKVYVAALPEMTQGKKRFYTLYDNGQLLIRARSKGFEPTKVMTGGDGGGVDWKGMINADRNSLWFPEGILKSWNNLEDVEIFVQPNVGYVTNYLTLASVDEKNGVAQTALPATYPMGKIDKHLHAIEGGSCRVENVIDYLDSPGEWVVNTREKLVYYWPESGKPEKVTFPALTEYFLVDGHEAGGIVRNIVFKELTFTRGEREVITKNDIGLQHEWDMWNKANAMLRFRDVEYCEVSSCRFTNSGSAAIRLDLHAQSNLIKNNLIDYVGGTGILLSGYGPGKLNLNKSNRILNNQIHHCGEFYYQSNGIMVWQSGENIIQNNKLHHLPYDAIVLSGTRPMFFQLKGENREQVGTLRTDEIAPEALYQEDTIQYNYRNFIYFSQWTKAAPYFHTRNNIVQDNEVFLVMQKCFDGNAIYLSDVGDGNEIRRNYIHHLNGMGMQQGIRTDAFLKNTTIAENIIYNCNCGGINLKYYENNAYNNIIADIHDIVYENSAGKTNRMFVGYFSIMDVFTRERMPPYTACNIQNNILYKVASHNTFYRQGNVNGELTELKIEECNIDKNLYFDTNLNDHGQSALEYYRTRGADKNSVVADPLFRDIKNGDFRLKENSPAYQMGFKDIDVKRIGITSEFPASFKDQVKIQLGDDYDNFHKLEALCKPAKDTLVKVPAGMTSDAEKGISTVLSGAGVFDKPKYSVNVAVPQKWNQLSGKEIFIPRISGEWIHVYKPENDVFPGPDSKRFKTGVNYDDWQVNDHAIIKGADDCWHAIGITHPAVVAGPGELNPHEAEWLSFHAVSSKGTLKQNLAEHSWKDRPKILPPGERPGEIREIHAPHIIPNDQEYFMIYGPSPIRYATSKDLFLWKPKGELFSQPGGARDPSVMEYNGLYYMAYCSKQSIMARVSADLLKWSEPITIFELPEGETGGAESPAIHHFEGSFYLLFCRWDAKLTTRTYQDRSYVYHSDNPLNFRNRPPVAEIQGHAPELFQDEDGDWWISSAERPFRGVSIAPVKWVQFKN